MKPWDVAIVGGGILGTSLAHWLSSRYEGRFALYEQEGKVGTHASGRNTGVVHRPFYLHPERSRLFARAALASYPLWEAYAKERELPWVVVGTLKLALRPEQLGTLDTYLRWSDANGLEEGEVVRLDPEEVGRLEPEVRCEGAVLARRETAVDFGLLTRELRKDAEANGVRMLTGSRVSRLRERREAVELWVDGEAHRASHAVNCAGGGAVPLAHASGVAREYAALHFRGEYWRVRREHFGLAGRNLYVVPRDPDFPFLDPHWIVRASGYREIGPNAVPVTGPWTYEAFAGSPAALLRRLFDPPMANKARLAVSPTFLGMAARELLGSLSRGVLAARVRQFLPRFRDAMLADRGAAGVRSSVVDPRGRFVKEILELHGDRSTHVLNYNSPGATGAPGYAALLLSRMEARGLLSHLRVRTRPRGPWRYEEALRAFD